MAGTGDDSVQTNDSHCAATARQRTRARRFCLPRTQKSALLVEVLTGETPSAQAPRAELWSPSPSVSLTLAPPPP